MQLDKVEIVLDWYATVLVNIIFIEVNEMVNHVHCLLCGLVSWLIIE